MLGHAPPVPMPQHAGSSRPSQVLRNTRLMPPQTQPHPLPHAPQRDLKPGNVLVTIDYKAKVAARVLTLPWPCMVFSMGSWSHFTARQQWGHQLDLAGGLDSSPFHAPSALGQLRPPAIEVHAVCVMPSRPMRIIGWAGLRRAHSWPGGAHSLSIPMEPAHSASSGHLQTRTCEMYTVGLTQKGVPCMPAGLRLWAGPCAGEAVHVHQGADNH